MDRDKLLPLPPRLIAILVAINDGDLAPIAKADIDFLLAKDFIAIRQPGWALSSTGRELVKKVSKPKGRKVMTWDVID